MIDFKLFVQDFGVVDDDFTSEIDRKLYRYEYDRKGK